MNKSSGDSVGGETTWTRRGLLHALGASAGAVTLLAAAGMADASDFPEFKLTGKKVRVGLPMTYGPENKPWRRGIWRTAKQIVDAGGEVVSIRGEPTKQSEQDAFRSLMERGIDVLVIGSLSSEAESAGIVTEAHSRGIKTVGFAVEAKDSPCVVGDYFSTSLAMGRWLLDRFQREGVFAQTADDRGYYYGFDQQVDMLSLLLNYYPRSKLLPFLPGGTGAQDEISKARENTMSLFQANPAPESIQAIVSWWIPLTLGTVQACNQMNRKVVIGTHNFDERVLAEMARPGSPVEFCTDNSFETIGDQVGKLAMALGQGLEVPLKSYQVGPTTVTSEGANAVREHLLSADKEATTFLAQFGG